MLTCLPEEGGPSAAVIPTALLQEEGGNLRILQEFLLAAVCQENKCLQVCHAQNMHVRRTLYIKVIYREHLEDKAMDMSFNQLTHHKMGCAGGFAPCPGLVAADAQMAAGDLFKFSKCLIYFSLVLLGGLI